MSNFFNTINIGLKSLQAQKKSMDTTSHNISNANTEGYSKQRAIHSTTDPYTVPGMGMPQGAGQVGTGVEISEIERVKNQFIEGQIWDKKQGQGYWEKRYQGLHRAELVVNEPSENSLSAVMDNFWNSLNDLSNNPEDTAIRATVKERATTLADTFHSLDDQLADYKKSLNRDVNTTVKEINSLARRVADLNSQIVHIKGTGKNPNDLMDKRDNLVEKLNKKVNVQTNQDKRGNLNVSLGGISLVANDQINALTTESSDNNEDKILFEELDSKANIDNGELAAIKELRDEVIPGYREDLDNIAQKFATKFNDVHQAGYDLNGDSGENFFVSDSDTNQDGNIDDKDITADSILVNEIIKDDINKIAAGSLSDNQKVVTAKDDGSYTGEEYKITIDKDNSEYTLKNLETGTIIKNNESFTGDSIDLSSSIGLTFNVKDSGSAIINKGSGSGGNALDLANVIKKDKVFDGATVMDKYQSMVSSLGVEGQRANQMVSNQETLVNQLENQRQSISGVSLDEEMSQMIKYQQAYNAAAKLISNSDRMLDSLMSIIR